MDTTFNLDIGASLNIKNSWDEINNLKRSLQSLSKGASGAKYVLEEVTEVIKRVSSEMVNLQKVMNPVITDFDAMKEAAADIGIEYASSIDEVLQKMVEWGKQGRNQLEVIELTKASLLNANVTNMDYTDTVKYLSSAIDQFNINVDDSLAVIDKWNYVSNNFKVTATELAESINQAGGAANAIALSIDQLIGLTTAIAQSTNKSGNEIGQMLQTMFTRFNRASEKSEGYLNNFERTLNNLVINGKRHSIALKDEESNYRNLFEVLKDVSGVWKDLNQVQKNSIAEIAGGKKIFSEFNALMYNFDLAINATGTSLASMGSAWEENTKYIGSMEAQMQQVKTAAERVSIALGDAGLNRILFALANMAESFFRALEDTIRGFSSMNHVLKEVLSTSVGIPALVLAFFNLKKAILTIKGVIGILGVTFNPWVAGLTLAITSLGALSFWLGKNKREMNELEEATASLNQLFQANSVITYNQASVIQRQLKEFNQLLDELDMLMIDKGPTSIPNYLQRADDLSKQEELINEFEKFPKIFTKLNDGSLKTTEEKIQYIRDLVVDMQEKFAGIRMVFQDISNYADMTKEELYDAIQGVSNELKTLISDRLTAIQQKVSEIIEVFNIDKEQLNFKVELGLVSEGLAYEKQLEALLQSKLEQLFSIRKQLALFDKSPEFEQINELKNVVLEELNRRLKESPNVILENLKNQLVEATKPYELIDKLLSSINELVKATSEELLEQRQIVKDLAETERKREEFHQALVRIQEAKPQTVEQARSFLAEAKDLQKIGKEYLHTDIVTPDLHNLLDDQVKRLHEELNNLSDAVTVENFNQKFNELLKIDIAVLGIDELKKLINTLKELETEGERLVQNKSITPGKHEVVSSLLANAEEELNSSVAQAKKIKAVTDGMIIQGQRYQAMADTIETFRTNFRSYLKTDITAMSPEELEQFIGKGNQLIEQAQKYHQMWLLSDKQLDYFSVKINDLGKTANKLRLSAIIDYNFEQTLTPLEMKIQQLEKAKEIHAEAQIKGLDAEEIDKQKSYIEWLQKQIDEIFAKEREENFFDALNLSLEHTRELLADFDLSEIIGTAAANDAIKELKTELSRLGNIRREYEVDLAYGVLTEKEFEQAINKIGLDKEKIKLLLTELSIYKEEVRASMKEAVLEGIIAAFNSFNETSTFTEILSNAFRNVLNNIFTNNNLKEDFENFIENILKFSPDQTTGIMTGLESFAQGNSVLGSALAGIGAGIAASNPLLGGFFSIIGGIGSSLWGGDEGRSRSDLDGLKNMINEARDYLKDYKVEDLIPGLKWRDRASWWKRLWGGSKIQIFNEEEVKQAIEKIKGIINDMSGGISNALKNAFAMDAVEFGKAIEQSLRQTLQNALITSIMDQAFLKAAIGQVTRVIARITADGILTDREITQYQEIVNRAQDAFRRGKDMADTLGSIPGVSVEMNQSTDQSFQAGTTSNYTYNNYFSVNSQIFNGSEEEARQAAELLAPFITEYMFRAEGA